MKISKQDALTWFEFFACLPPEAEIMTTADDDPADLLHVFLSTADESEEELIVIAGSVVCLPSLPRREGTAKLAPVYRANRERLMEALDENFLFSRFLKDNCAILSDCDGFYAVDSPAAALSLADALRRDRLLRLLKQGVEIYDCGNCYIEPTVRIESGAKILPGAILKGSSVIRSESVIGPWSVVENSEIGEGSVVNASQIYSSKIAAQVHIGPYAHIRGGAELGKGVKIGNFVEVKNAKIGEDTWASHLSYLGDAQIGARCNFGCGTVTTNYDGDKKYRCTIGDRSFIGCNTNLVAPVTLADGVYTAAGSTVTEDVPDHALAIARSRQSNKKDWASKHKKSE